MMRRRLPIAILPIAVLLASGCQSSTKIEPGHTKAERTTTTVNPTWYRRVKVYRPTLCTEAKIVPAPSTEPKQ